MEIMIFIFFAPQQRPNFSILRIFLGFQSELSIKGTIREPTRRVVFACGSHNLAHNPQPYMSAQNHRHDESHPGPNDQGVAGQPRQQARATQIDKAHEGEQK